MAQQIKTIAIQPRTPDFELQNPDAAAHVYNPSAPVESWESETGKVAGRLCAHRTEMRDPDLETGRRKEAALGSVLWPPCVVWHTAGMDSPAPAHLLHTHPQSSHYGARLPCIWHCKAPSPHTPVTGTPSVCRWDKLSGSGPP